MSELAVLDHTGDTRLQWDKSDADQVRAAELRFDELKRKGFAAFRVNKADTKGEQIDDFDPHAERILLVPQMIGG